MTDDSTRRDAVEPAVANAKVTVVPNGLRIGYARKVTDNYCSDQVDYSVDLTISDASSKDCSTLIKETSIWLEGLAAAELTRIATRRAKANAKHLAAMRSNAGA